MKGWVGVVGSSAVVFVCVLELFITGAGLWHTAGFVCSCEFSRDCGEFGCHHQCSWLLGKTCVGNDPLYVRWDVKLFIHTLMWCESGFTSNTWIKRLRNEHLGTFCTVAVLHAFQLQHLRHSVIMWNLVPASLHFGDTYVHFRCLFVQLRLWCSGPVAWMWLRCSSDA